MISNKEELLAWKSRAALQPAGRVVLDLEADSLHRYHEKICLIQYADESESCMIDPLSIEDMSPFSAWLANATIWMHGADYDMSLFMRTWGHLPGMLLDTQTAARLLGFRQFGLAAIVDHFHGVTLSKSSQKADWGKRPLPANMLEYALNDVNYMLSMADTMVASLKEKGRYEWFLEICHNSMDKARERHATGHADPWRIQGSGRLTRLGLAALQTLWEWRDAEASVWDKPSFMVCSNADLIRWSNEAQDQKTIQPLDRFHAHRRTRFLDSLQKFYQMDEDEYPERILRIRKHKCELFDDRLAKLIEKRDTAAQKLEIDPSFLASRSTLESIAENEESGIASLLDWQVEVMGFLRK
ncbi:MAG: hypothetical protein RR250_05190 [Akkermansia sp.]